MAHPRPYWSLHLLLAFVGWSVAFRQFLQSAVDWMDRNPERTTKERLVLIYAWNEFGEGGYIAPTEGDRDGAYLKAVKAVVNRE